MSRQARIMQDQSILVNPYFRFVTVFPLMSWDQHALFDTLFSMLFEIC
jgi:hypothetical protein